MTDFLVPNLKFLSLNGSPQGRVGTAAGVGQPAVSKIITGQTKEPGYKTVMGLAKHYGVTVDDLLTRDLERDGPSMSSQPARIDVGKLASLIETVEASIVASRRQASPRQKAVLVTKFYMDETAAGTSPDAMQALLTSILVSLEEA